VAWLGPIAISAVAVLLAAAVGVFQSDFDSFSGFRAATTAGGPLPVPLPVLIALVGAAFCGTRSVLLRCGCGS
jgi:hypothetical protein